MTSNIATQFAAGFGRVYGGDEPAGYREARAFRYWRKRGRPALEALRLAREDAAAGRSRWPSSSSPGLGAPMESDSYGCGGGRWAELPESMGFRFIGFADELAKRYGSRLDHNGWYMEPDGWSGELARGAVYQMAARNGCARYVPAIRVGSENKAGIWSDQSGGDSAILFLADIEEGERGGSEDVESAAMEAARYADSRAERFAEAERDYQEAWQAGRQAAELSEEAAAERRAFLALRAELKAAQAAPGLPAICEALRSALARHCEAWSDAKCKAAELREEWSGLGAWRSHLESAFQEGLGQ